MNIDKNFELEEIYENAKIIDLENLLNKEDITIIRKLGYDINSKFSAKQFEKLLHDIVIDYYIDPKRVTSSEDLPRKNLDETKVTRERYNELIAKLDKIELEVVSNISINALSILFVTNK